MKKTIAVILTLVMALFLFTACGKEAVPVETTEAPAATTLPIVEEVTEAVVETIAETEPPTESIPVALQLDIDNDIYTLPVMLNHLIVNNWEVSCKDDTFIDGDISATFSRNGVSFYGRLSGSPGGSVYDDDVMVSHIEFMLQDGSAFAILYDCFYAGMDMAEIVPTMESLGFINIDTYDMGDGDAMIHSYNEEYNYGLSFVVEAGAVIGMVIDN